MEVGTDYGSITKGKKASLIITKPLNSFYELPYAFGSNLIDKVILNGELQ
jgi:imidazolonepropionase